jgi:hypothetical protein
VFSSSRFLLVAGQARLVVAHPRRGAGVCPYIVRAPSLDKLDGRQTESNWGGLNRTLVVLNRKTQVAHA